MNIKFERLLYSDTGRILISIILALGFASLFHKVCKDKDCIRFEGPVISEIDGKIFEHDDKCYQYETRATSCENTDKSILNFSTSRDPFQSKLNGMGYGKMNAK
jgi:hypothetical protein